MRLPWSVPAFVALVSVGAFAAGAAAKPHHMRPKSHMAKAHMAVSGQHLAASGQYMPSSPYKFPNYVDHGTDYNPGSDNRYFSDTGAPAIFNGPNNLGPAYFQRWWTTTY